MLLNLTPEVAEEHTNGWIFRQSRSHVVNQDRREDGLSGFLNAWAE